MSATATATRPAWRSRSTASRNTYRDLTRAISTPHPPYEALGVKVDGEYRQLNANILQIENEYYSFIRPKRVARSGERPTKALRRAGVEYVEVRALDVSAFDPVGVNQNKLRFLEAFLALCLMKESAADRRFRAGRARPEPRHRGAPRARAGADAGARGPPGAACSAGPASCSTRCPDCARCSTTATRPGPTRRPWPPRRRRSTDAALTPSARLMTELNAGESFFNLALRMSTAHKAYFLDLYPPNEERLAEFGRQAQESLAAQKQIEDSDRGTFEEYLARYFAN